ncbi:hypothetical protein MTR62_14680 [Novosphingobium sp. 1949]|uniref:Uncharacterized protein n=1 Tax=Novosphingobium organovorum TaxID=2930092 RepID=A0ABT0BG74_9SPHN|nr:hypothetical protein [Novosphingobium organovorum]MCJ2183930.1 hypothetical protein [Novosphingobium organovorum]
MSGNVPRLFADITALLEDMHAVAVEGQRRDNAPDMQSALVGLLQSRVATLDASLAKISLKLGGGHD